jgi:hypothetical protein
LVGFKGASENYRSSRSKERTEQKSRYDLSKFSTEEKRDMRRSLMMPIDNFSISGFPPSMNVWK